MKNLKPIYLSLLMLPVFANGQVTKTDALANKVETVRANIRTSLQDIRNTQESTKYEFPDLEYFFANFYPKVEKEFQVYVSDFEVQIIQPLKKAKKEYDSIANSSQFSAEEKTFMLDDFFTKHKNKIETAYWRFASSKEKSFDDLLGLPKNFIGYVPFMHHRFSDYFHGNDGLVEVEKVYEMAVQAGYFASTKDHIEKVNSLNLLSELVYFKSCLSRGCQNLLTLTYKKYFEAVTKLMESFRVNFSNVHTLEFKHYYSSSIPRKISEIHKSTQDYDLPLTIDRKFFDTSIELIKIVNESESLNDCLESTKSLKLELCQIDGELCKNDYIKMYTSANIMGHYAPTVERKLKPQLEIKEDSKFPRWGRKPTEQKPEYEEIKIPSKHKSKCFE